jgi:hypothetical protein
MVALKWLGSVRLGRAGGLDRAVPAIADRGPDANAILVTRFHTQPTASRDAVLRCAAAGRDQLLDALVELLGALDVIRTWFTLAA